MVTALSWRDRQRTPQHSGRMYLSFTKQEREAGGVLDMDTKIISTITSHGPAYLDKDKEKIVGFQTDKPFKRSLQPYGGIRMVN